MDAAGWSQFCADLTEIYDSVAQNDEGDVADYIPQLAMQDPAWYGVAVTSVDGRRFELGDSRIRFCIQSCSKPMTYALGLQQHGSEKVAQHIGREPSGERFNAFTFDDENKPHNALINAGAMMAASLIDPGSTPDVRFETIMNAWRRCLGVGRVGFDNGTYLSEARTANRNFALAHLMMENGVFPAGTDITETLQLYFQACSITADATGMADFAAMLANGGNLVERPQEVATSTPTPTSVRRDSFGESRTPRGAGTGLTTPTSRSKYEPGEGEAFFSPALVRDVLCAMYAAGMYDYSGRWSFDVGLPAKSGVAGAVFVVVPNVCGICVYSPRLDKMGNSVRAVALIEELVKRYDLHIFDTLVRGVSASKKSMKKRSAMETCSQLCEACAMGDVHALTRIIRENGVGCVNQGDYDKRYPIHIATEEAKLECLCALLDAGARINVKDRWGMTPLIAAKRLWDEGPSSEAASEAEDYDDHGANGDDFRNGNGRRQLDSLVPEPDDSEQVLGILMLQLGFRAICRMSIHRWREACKPQVSFDGSEDGGESVGASSARGGGRRSNHGTPHGTPHGGSSARKHASRRSHFSAEDGGDGR